MPSGYKELVRNKLKDKEVVIVSSRGPYTFKRTKQGVIASNRGGGGLVSAFLSLLNDIDITWISLARTKVDREIGLKGIPIGPKKKSLAKFVYLDSKTYSSFYHRMCNEVLWFIQHGLCDTTYHPVFTEQTINDWISYKKANELFAQALQTHLEGANNKETIVLFQDYHLYLAARYFSKNSTVKTSHFTHIPWPSPETASIFSKRILTSILEGLLSNDLVGFHCDNYVFNFLSACEQFLELPIDYNNQLVSFNGRWVPVRSFPISIDFTSLSEEAGLINENALRSKNNTAKYIFRADRIDPSKNIIRGFLSFERMLDLFPQFHKKVIFKANLYKSRQELKSYRQYQKIIKQTVAKINKRFSTIGWQPIQLSIQDNYHQTLAEYKHFDVLIVNSIADGMNLVAKEGPLLNTNDGVLILSSKTGAYNELSHFCLPVNPFDINETAHCMKDALVMPKNERAQRLELLKKTIKTNSIVKWLYYQLSELTESKEVSKTTLSL